MSTFILRRLALAVAELFLIVTGTFFLLHILPGDPAQIILGGGQGAASPQAVAALRHRLSLDLPLGTQYVRWVGGVLHGNLGFSLLDSRAVTADLAADLPKTFEIICLGLFIATVAGLGLGVLAARRRGSAIDRLLTSFTLMIYSVPPFVTGIVLILFFAVQLRWLPSSGFRSFAESPGAALRSLLLPSITLAIPSLGMVMRMIRASVIDELGQHYVRTARAFGCTERRILYRHVLRNALLPTVTLVGLQFGFMFAGSVVVETVFNWPGVNLLLVYSAVNRDYPVVQGIILTTAAIYILVNLGTEILYAVLDPRIRY